MPCNQVPSIRRHKAQTRITILFALIALALTALPTVSFAGTDTAGNVLATEVDSTPSGIEGDLYWAGQSLNLDDASIGRDIIAAGENLSIRDCTVGGAVRLAARTIDIAKTAIDGSVTVAGQHVVLNTGSTANCFYAAGETEGNTRILFLLDSQQNVQNGGGFGVVDSQLVALERPFAAFDRIVAEYAYVANNF